jgi:putative nucleotidyltransferase with HDIG domain
MAHKESANNHPPPNSALLYALNAAATQLQGSIRNEQQVYDAFREQIIQLGMRGGISLLDEKRETLEFKVIAQPLFFSKIMHTAEEDIGLKAHGFRVPVSKVDTYRMVIEKCQAQFVPDTSIVSAQVVPAIAKPVVKLLLSALGSPPGIFAPLIRHGKPVGMLNVVGKDLVTEDLPAMQAFANHIAVALDNASLVSSLQQAKDELEDAYSATLEGWVRALDLRDNETEGHTLRVAELTVKLWQAMRLDEKVIPHIRRGALLHDIGKMAIPDHILKKPGVLNEEEWALMRQHPKFAYEWMRPIAFLTPAQAIPHCHHERYDGTGYPRGLRGEEIPLEARIFAVVDVYDAMRSDRPYRTALSDDRVFAYLDEQSGRHFDPFVVQAFLELN